MNKKSQIRWSFFKIIHERITKQQKIIWKEFLSWIMHQGSCIEIYFKAEEWRWTLSKDNEWLKIVEEGEEKWYKKHELLMSITG